VTKLAQTAVQNPTGKELVKRAGTVESWPYLAKVLDPSGHSCSRAPF
jgi:hypothetical protein